MLAIIIDKELPCLSNCLNTVSDEVNRLLWNVTLFFYFLLLIITIYKLFKFYKNKDESKKLIKIGINFIIYFVIILLTSSWLSYLFSIIIDDNF